MEIFTTSESIHNYILALKESKLQVGFVPTMGALHKGHFSLIEQCKRENNVCVVSIFVNPTQFNNKQDLDTYPNTLEQDKQFLEELDCDILFLPTIKDIYPNYPEVDLLNINLGKLNTELEAKHRPGHFDGVATVVNRLFKAVPSHKGYFGRKDFQQILVIKKLITTQKFDITIIECDTVRESDGLAMSSRNVKLSKKERNEAALINEALNYIKDNYLKLGIQGSIEKATEIINESSILEIEYLKVVNSNLEEVSNSTSEKLIICTAVYAGKTRLIDNINLN